MPAVEDREPLDQEDRDERPLAPDPLSKPRRDQQPGKVPQVGLHQDQSRPGVSQCLRQGLELAEAQRPRRRAAGARSNGPRSSPPSRSNSSPPARQGAMTSRTMTAAARP